VVVAVVVNAWLVAAVLVVSTTSTPSPFLE
jgi:hypothetical protein